MTIKALEVFARVVETDAKTGTEQVRDLFSNETEKGWLNLGTVSTQQLNGILKSITQHTPCNPFAPQPMIASYVTPATAIDWVDGGAIPVTAVELIAHYGANFPIYQTPPAGWKYIVRNQ